MKVLTRHWGPQEVDANAILSFPEGIPGFPAHRRFVLLAGGKGPFLWLQSLDEQEVALPVAEAFNLFPDYEVELDTDDVAVLQVSDPAQVAVFVAVTVRGDPLQATANLLAPILVNTASRLGRQKILRNPSYSVRRPLFPEAVP